MRVSAVVMAAARCCNTANSTLTFDRKKKFVKTNYIHTLTYNNITCKHGNVSNIPNFALANTFFFIVQF